MKLQASNWILSVSLSVSSVHSFLLSYVGKNLLSHYLSLNIFFDPNFPALLFPLTDNDSIDLVLSV